MSIVLTLLCINSTITTEVHSRIETQLYTFTFRETSTHLDQSQKLILHSSQRTPVQCQKNKLHLAIWRKGLFLTVQRKLKVVPLLSRLGKNR